MNGKGSRRRPTDERRYSQNWESIFEAGLRERAARARRARDEFMMALESEDSMSEKDRLTRYADKFGTDKGSKFHRYTPFYDLLFRELHFDPHRVLELGALDGASLAMWASYFPNTIYHGGEVLGVDHLPENARELAERYGARVEGGDLGDPVTLEALAARGPWDLIIDDASHRVEHQRLALSHLWAALSPGGLFILEDADTGWRDDYGGSPGMLPPLSAQAVWGLDYDRGAQTWAYRTPKGTLALVWRKPE